MPGTCPAAIRNYLALLGWGAEDDATILPTPELIERFALDRVRRSSAIFDERKLRWLNGRYMRDLPLDEYADAVAAHLVREGGDRRRRRPRGPARRVRDRPRQGPDADRGLAADPLPVRAPGRRPAGLGEGDGR